MLPTIDDTYGGPPRGILAVLALGGAADIRSTVVAGATQRGDIARQMESLSHLTVFRPGALLGRLQASASMLRTLWSALADADVVIAHSLFSIPSVFSGIVCKVRRKPWIMMPHGSLDPYDVLKHRRLKQLLSPLWRLILNSGDLWCLTELEARHAVTFGARPRRHVVPYPVKLTDPLPVDEALGVLARLGAALGPYIDGGGSIVSFVGRFDVKKGIPRLLDSFDAVAGPQDVLVLGGRGDPNYERLIDQHISTLRLRDQVLRPGWLHDTEKVALWSLPGFFALASDDENFGVAVAEAMAAGMPVVITEQVGLADLVKATGAGLVTEPKVDEVAQAMAIYLADAERRRKDGENARSAVQDFLSPDVVAEAFRRMLEASMKGHESRFGRGEADVKPPSGFVCPCCEATSGTVVRRVSPSEAATHHVRPWVDGKRHLALLEHIRGLWAGGSCDIVRCSGCGTRTSSPFVAGDARFYELAFGHTGRYPAAKWEFDRALDVLAAGEGGGIPKDLRVLEFGAGRGSFLRHLISNGVDPAGLAAVEYSHLGRHALRQLDLGHVGDEQPSWREAPSSWRGAFDAVALFQVLEHLDDLDSKLSFLRSCLRPGGLLLVAVPNDARIRFNEEHGALLDQPPNHITCFSRDGLAALAARAGFEVASWSVQPSNPLHDIPPMHFSRYLRRSQREGSLAARSFALRPIQARRLAALTYMLVTAPATVRLLPSLREGASTLAVLRPSYGQEPAAEEPGVITPSRLPQTGQP